MAESKAAFAARRRDEYIAALEAELVGYKRYGNAKRAKDVQAEIERVRELGEQEAAAAAERASAAESGADVTPNDASPYGEMSLRDLKEAAAARSITVDGGRTRQDFIDALEKADEQPLSDGSEDDESADDQSAGATE